MKRCRFECTVSVTSHPSYPYSSSTGRWKKWNQSSLKYSAKILVIFGWLRGVELNHFSQASPGRKLRYEGRKTTVSRVSEEQSIPELLRKWLQTYNHGLVMVIRKDFVLGRLDKYLKTDERPYWTSKEEHASERWFRCIDWATIQQCNSLKTSQISKTSQFQVEAKCKNFPVKMSLFAWDKKKSFRSNGFALSLALKQRLGATRKWPIAEWRSIVLDWNMLSIQ